MSDKPTIRKAARERRDSLATEDREKACAIIAKNVVEMTWFKNADQLLLYLPVHSEVDTWPLVKQAWAAGKAVYAPVVDEKNKGMNFYRFEEGESLEKDSHGVPAPRPVASRKADMGRPCLLVLPCLAFDRQGGRIGYGAGYYDRFLEGAGRAWKRVALAYAVQEAEGGIPLEDHDQKLHAVVTEKETIVF